MNVVEMVDSIATVLLVVAGLLMFGQVSVYTVLARWWRSADGFYLAASGVMFAALLTYNFAALMDWFDEDDPTVRAWTRLVIYAAATALALWRTGLLVRAQLDGARQRRKERR